MPVYLPVFGTLLVRSVGRWQDNGGVRLLKRPSYTTLSNHPLLKVSKSGPMSTRVTTSESANS